EKCADALHQLGLVATTNHGGALQWCSVPQEIRHAALRGRTVVVLPDNDNVGRDHARAVAADLAGVAREIRILRLDGLAEHEDVYDWLQQRDALGSGSGSGSALQELLERALTCAPYDPYASYTTHDAALADAGTEDGASAQAVAQCNAIDIYMNSVASTTKTEGDNPLSALSVQRQQRTAPPQLANAALAHGNVTLNRVLDWADIVQASPAIPLAAKSTVQVLRRELARPHQLDRDGCWMLNMTKE